MSAAWLVEALIASTLLMGFVLVVRKPAQRAFGPQLAYWLWALPILRMITPPLPAGWRESAAAPISAVSETVLVYVAPAATMAADPVAAPFPWLALIAAAWVLGALAFFVWHGAAHFAYVRRIVAPPARHERLADGTTLVESEEAMGPVAFGVLRRFVAVPRDFAERYDADERRLALAHELGHHARGDLVANWIALAVLAAHWFNPLAWVAYRKFRTDQELANDARVLAALPAVERHAYACAILKAANGRAITAACHLHTIEDLKGRLRMLKASRKSRRVLLAGATGIMALTVAGLGLTASGAAAERIRTTATTQVVTMSAQAAPITPPPPAAVPATEPAPPVPPMEHRAKKVVLIKDGKTETYEGAAAEAYMNAHPAMRPPAPPVPPMGARGPSSPMPPMVIATNGGKTVMIERVRGGGPDADGFALFHAPEVVEGDCRNKESGQLIINDKNKDGKPRMLICKMRIERFAADQARIGKMRALEGLRAGRAAIEASGAMSDAQRAQALAGMESARAAIEAEMKAEN